MLLGGMPLITFEGVEGWASLRWSMSEGDVAAELAAMAIEPSVDTMHGMFPSPSPPPGSDGAIAPVRSPCVSFSTMRWRDGERDVALETAGYQLRELRFVQSELPTEGDALAWHTVLERAYGPPSTDEWTESWGVRAHVLSWRNETTLLELRAMETERGWTALEIWQPTQRLPIP